MMKQPLTAREWTLNALTPIWTGDANRQGDRLIPTGLLGSIRWWFEVLVRGLDGKACDPSDVNSRCPDKDGKRCLVCEAFGCTSWSRKFRLQLLGKDHKPLSKAIKAGEIFYLRVTPLRFIHDEEWGLLDLTLRLIADYGAIGGRTVFKPTEEAGRGHLAHHQDYGIVAVKAGDAVVNVAREKLLNHVRASRWRSMNHGDFSWASLASFWSVKGRYLARQTSNISTFNRVIDRPEPKNQAAGGGGWLAGRQGESKKVFSFKNPPRTYGFVKPGSIDFRQMKERLKRAWPDLKDADFVPGDKVIRRLLNNDSGDAAGV